MSTSQQVWWPIKTLLVFAISGCEFLSKEAEQGDKLVADTLYVNANVWTGDESLADAQQVAVDGDRIVMVNNLDNSEYEASNVVDIENRFVMLGFIDYHVHFFDGGYGLASVDLRDANTPAEFSRRNETPRCLQRGVSFEPQELAELVHDADRAQLKLALHAIGGRAINELLDVYQSIDDSAQRRFRSEHFQHPSKSAIKKLATPGAIATSHPYHAIDDGRWLEEKVAAERAKASYAFRSILDADGLLSLGSDWLVAPLASLQGVYAAVTREAIDGKNP